MERDGERELKPREDLGRETVRHGESSPVLWPGSRPARHYMQYSEYMFDCGETTRHGPGAQDGQTGAERL